MAGLLINRQRIFALAMALALTVVAAFWFYQPDRHLRRTWDGLLDAIEARNTTRVGQVVAQDYHDRWGYTRRSILEDARLAFLQLRHLELTAEQVRFERTGDEATISAILRIDADGSAGVAEARTSVNASYTPFVFIWRREPGFAGAWKLAGFNHPEIDPARFRAGW